MKTVIKKIEIVYDIAARFALEISNNYNSLKIPAVVWN